MTQVHVIQRLSPCLLKDSDKYVKDALPGMLLVDNKPVQSVDVRVLTVGLQWLDCNRRKVLYIRYECRLLTERGDQFCFLAQRPVSAELTGEMKELHNYRVTAEKYSKLVGADQAEEIKGGL